MGDWGAPGGAWPPQLPLYTGPRCALKKAQAGWGLAGTGGVPRSGSISNRGRHRELLVSLFFQGLPAVLRCARPHTVSLDLIHPKALPSGERQRRTTGFFDRQTGRQESGQINNGSTRLRLSRQDTFSSLRQFPQPILQPRGRLGWTGACFPSAQWLHT